MNHHESLPLLYGKVRIMVVSVLVLAMISCPVSYHYAIGNHPLSVTGVILVDILLLMLLTYAVMGRIVINVDDTGIRINRCFVPASEITGCEYLEDVHTYRRFGGVGIRAVPGRRGYTSSKVKSGITVKRKNGPDIIVSSEEPDELMRCIDSLVVCDGIL